MSDANESLVEYLSRLDRERFWGSLTIKFEAGRIVHIRREQNLKPEELSGELRPNHGAMSRTKR
jgi:hypothetical protein